MICYFQVIKDYQLMLMVAFLMFLDFAILSLWQILDPVRRQTQELPPEVSKVDGTASTHITVAYHLVFITAVGIDNNEALHGV